MQAGAVASLDLVQFHVALRTSGGPQQVVCPAKRAFSEMQLVTPLF